MIKGTLLWYEHTTFILSIMKNIVTRHIEVGLDLFYFNLLAFICFYVTFLKFHFL